jgi:hypothetical protein
MNRNERILREVSAALREALSQQAEPVKGESK